MISLYSNTVTLENNINKDRILIEREKRDSDLDNNWLSEL
jgi:hypothetical protein